MNGGKVKKDKRMGTQSIGALLPIPLGGRLNARVVQELLHTLPAQDLRHQTICRCVRQDNWKW